MNLRNTFLSSLLLLITSVSCAEQPLVQFVLPSQIPATYKEFGLLMCDCVVNYIYPRCDTFVRQRCTSDLNSTTHEKEKEQLDRLAVDYENPYLEKLKKTIKQIYKVHANSVNNELAKKEIAQLTNEYINFVLNTLNQIDELIIEKKIDVVQAIAQFLQTVNQKNR